MPVLSHAHHLFNVEQCQAYTHTLRWKDRPLQCPRCQSYRIGRWGTYHYRPGCRRYWCQSCKGTLRSYSYPTVPEQAAAGLLDPRHLFVVSRLFVPVHCAGGGDPYPDLIVNLAQGEQCSFLSFDFRRVWYPPKLKKRTALLRKLKEICRRYQSQPIDRVIALINPILRGLGPVFCDG